MNSIEALKTVERNDATIPTPERLLQMGMGFWASKVVLAAVKLDLFTLLGDDRLTAEDIQRQAKLHPRSVHDFLDSLAALRIIRRTGRLYSNTLETSLYLNRRSPSYLGDIFLMANDRNWHFWGRLDEELCTGRPQNETRQDGKWVLDVLYADAAKRDLFVESMIGLSTGTSLALAQRFDFSRVRRLCDVGGGPGTLCAAVAKAHPHVECVNMDLAPVQPVFQKYMARQGSAAQARFHAGDCLKDSWPQADVYAMGHLLHGFGPEDRLAMLGRAYASLPRGGTLIVIEALIDDDRVQNAFSLLMSLNMALETSQGRNFTGKELGGWLRDVGFQEITTAALAGPYSMTTAIKR